MSEGQKKKGFQSVGNALDGYLERSGLAERLAAASTLPEWERRVGAGIAEVTEPVRVSGTTLFVAVRSSAWLMELKLMERDILARINAGRERGRIESIRFFLQER